MKKITLVTVMFLLSITVVAQLKTYSGAYDRGTATYTYKEIDYERIKEGSFSFLYKEPGFVQKITATYKNDTVDGKYTNSVTVTDKKLFPDSPYRYTGTITSTANYINGAPYGTWKYSVLTKRVNITMNTSGKLVYGPLQLNQNITATGTFVDGALRGKLSYVSTMKDFEETCDYNFDSSGYLHGTLTNIRGNIETIFEYYHGIFRKKISRDITTGKVISKFNSTLSIDTVKLILAHINDAAYLKNTFHVRKIEYPFNQYSSAVSYSSNYDDIEADLLKSICDVVTILYGTLWNAECPDRNTKSYSSEGRTKLVNYTGSRIILSWWCQSNTAFIEIR
jgi:hypothetical protein